MRESIRKVHFKVIQNEDGYPPFNSEGMWCIGIDAKRFRVDNIPFFVTGVSYNDVISVAEDMNGRLDFVKVVEEGGHSTLRVIINDECADQRPTEVRIRELAASLEELGCATAISPPPEILAIDVPPSASITKVQKMLSDGESGGLWSYEEGTLAH